MPQASVGSTRADWSGFAYHNGLAIPATGDPDSRYNEYAVVIGEKTLRLCAAQQTPILFANGTPVDFLRYRTRHAIAAQSPDDDRAEKHYEAFFYVNNARYLIEALQFDGTMLDLKLIEPDGSVWTARAGYRFGERFPSTEQTHMYSPTPWEEYRVAL